MVSFSDIPPGWEIVPGIGGTHEGIFRDGTFTHVIVAQNLLYLIRKICMADKARRKSDWTL